MTRLPLLPARASARRATALAAAGVSLVMLAGCGDDSPSVGSSTPSAGTGSQTPGGDTGSESSTTTAEPTTETTTSTSSTSTDSRNPADLVRTSVDSAKTADSGRMWGTATDDGQTIAIDITGKVDGSNQKAVVSPKDKGTATILTIGGTYYVKADEKFYTSNAQMTPAQAKLLANKYIKNTDKNSSFEEFTIKGFFSKIDTQLKLLSTGEQQADVTDTSLNGKPVIKLSNFKGDSENVEITMTADPKHFPLILKVGGKSPANLTFERWNAVPKFEAPPASQVIDLPGSGGSGAAG